MLYRRKKVVNNYSITIYLAVSMWHTVQLIQRVEISKIIGMTRHKIHGASGQGADRESTSSEQ